MFGQSFLLRIGVTKGLQKLGVPDDVAKCLGWAVGIGSMVLTLDAVGAGAEAAAAVGAEAAANIGADAAANVAMDITASAGADAAASAVAEGAISLAADHADVIGDAMGHAGSAVVDHAHSLLPDAVDLPDTDLPEADTADGNRNPGGQESLFTRLGHNRQVKLAELSFSGAGLGMDLAKTAAARVAEPERIPILFLASDPVNAKRLRVGEESREIREKLQLGKFRDNFAFQERNSVRPADTSQALLDVAPEIVHFSGHGTQEGALCCEDATGRMQFIQPGDLADLFAQFASNVRCVVLSACFSEMQAQAIVKHIQYVIGMSSAIGDQAAIAFAVGFYQALAAGRSVPDAFQFGCAQIGLQGVPGKTTPILLQRS
jgi:hypothetical protein